MARDESKTAMGVEENKKVTTPQHLKVGLLDKFCKCCFYYFFSNFSRSSITSWTKVFVLANTSFA